jgi:hypothetical protein
MGIPKNLQVSGKLVAAQYRYMEPGGPVINLKIVNLKSDFFALNADPASPFLLGIVLAGRRVPVPYSVLKLKVTCFYYARGLIF